MKRTRINFNIIFFLNILISSCCFAQSSGITVYPLKIDISKEKNNESLNLSNNLPYSTTMQATVMEWTQKNGIDSLVETNNLVVTPPLFKMQQDGRQIVRAGIDESVFNNRFSMDKEICWRLVLEQLPNDLQKKPGEIKILLKMTVPIFYSPAKKNHNFTIKDYEKNGNKYNIFLVNNGNVHEKVTKVQIKDAKDIILAEWTGISYYLSGTEKPLAVLLQKEGAAKRIIVQTEYETIEK